MKIIMSLFCFQPLEQLYKNYIFLSQFCPVIKRHDSVHACDTDSKTESVYVYLFTYEPSNWAEVRLLYLKKDEK